jgi:hypothetical protein
MKTPWIPGYLGVLGDVGSGQDAPQPLRRAQKEAG